MMEEAANRSVPQKRSRTAVQKHSTALNNSIGHGGARVTLVSDAMTVHIFEHRRCTSLSTSGRA
ncbi:protein of unknown function [Methylorubrum extorquens]|uniref:Uncharacterized protein n=1 Tax=Methylorubrum extorquens TaxID=408 RepID=A0A2N9AY36_METEX|nr:protein of unknown function [Methylorubrum extorquens]